VKTTFRTIQAHLKGIGGEKYTHMEPLFNRVLVERLPEKEKSEGGIYIPEVARDIPAFCNVIAVGPGRWQDGEFVKTAVKPGDTVMVPGAGNKFPDWKEGQSILITDEDIGAIVG
jgi:chaperonin GroES